MREALFIKKNKERWEQLGSSKQASADDLADEFIQLVDDLGYAKTFYPHSKITRFLNAQAARRYLAIYKNRKEDRNKLANFFTHKVPLTIARHHGVLLFCFIVFVAFFSLGFVSASRDVYFVREMLGDDYVATTEANIAAGNPFGIYQQGNSFFMFLGILINNASVAFRFFAEGVFFGIFTIKDLAGEALRIGAFEQMFFSKGLGQMSVLTVFIHGTLELAAIIVAAASGVVLGKGWLFPGTHTRLYALKQAAKDGVTIITAIVPVLVMAAFFEGFVTRHYKMPAVFSLLILALSLAFIVGYFVVWPLKLKKRAKQKGGIADV